ncbi:MAG: hypothetical protein EBS09_01415 [Flavobacteriia bacterium]|nr:hypothetical protein [Flavobacteriia bacterium]
MRIILLLGLLGITSIVFTQAPNIEWQKCLGGSDNEPVAMNTPNYIQKSKDGGYILISDTRSGDGDVTNFLGGDVWGGDIWIVKLESTGDIQWQRCLGGGGRDYSYSVTETIDSNFIILGSTYSSDISGFHGQTDILLTKIDKNGTIIWNKCIGGMGSDSNWNNIYCHVQSPPKLIELSGIGYLIAFESLSSDGDIGINYGLMDICLMQIDVNGVILNTKIIGGSLSDIAFSMIKAQDNSGFLILGSSFSNNGDFIGNHGLGDIVIFKVDNFLNLLWSKCLGSSEVDFPGSLLEDEFGNLFISGRSKEYFSDVSVYKLDAAGNVIFSKTFGGSGDDSGIELGIQSCYPLLYKNDNNEFFITTLTNSIDGDVSQNHGGYDTWIVKIDANGTIIWEKTFGGIYNEVRISNLIIYPNNEISFGLIVTHSSGNLVHSNFHEFPFDQNAQGWDIGIIKTNSLGNPLYYYCFGGAETESISNLIWNEITDELTFCGYAQSTDGDVIGNHGMADIWVAKLNSALSTNEIMTFQKSKTLINVVDLMGRDASIHYNQVLLYQFDDGSVVKKYISE